MKTTIRLIFGFILITSCKGFAQSDGIFPNIPIVADSLANTLQRYDYETRKTGDKSLFIELLERNGAQTTLTKNSLVTNYFDTHLVFNPSMLNVFFQKEITAFATSVKDLSIEKYFATVNSTDKTVAIGRTFDLRVDSPDRALKPMHNFLTVYVKAAVDDNYSSVYAKNSKTNEYEFSSGMGIGVRYTRFGNGIIFFDTVQTVHMDKIKLIRDTAVKIYIAGDVDTYLKGEYKADLAEVNAITPPAGQLAAQKKLVEKKHYEFYKKISDKEIEYLKKNNLYYSYLTYWVGVDAYIPLTRRKLNVKEFATVGIPEEKMYRDYRGEIFGNLFWSQAKGWSVLAKLVVSEFKNNKYLSLESKPITFQTVTDENATQQILGTSTLVFIGPYEEFWTTSLREELAFLFFKNSVGISGAITYNFGEYKATNWKLGIPFSLKDKDDKPTVNFEIQWKEVNDARTVGISVAYVFGTFK